MATESCDACGEDVRIAGGIGDFWTFEGESTGGMTLELADGSEFFLCFECLDRLPDDREVTAEDVTALEEEGEKEEEEEGEKEEEEEGEKEEEKEEEKEKEKEKEDGR